jgi:excisionase family DNA binding protein
MEQLLSPREVADRVPVGYHAILRAIRKGELRASLLRGKYAVRESDLEQWVDDNVVQPPAPAPVRALTDAGGFRGRARRQRGMA